MIPATVVVRTILAGAKGEPVFNNFKVFFGGKFLVSMNESAAVINLVS